MGYVRLASTAKTQNEQMLSALPPKADIPLTLRHACLVFKRRQDIPFRVYGPIV